MSLSRRYKQKMTTEYVDWELSSGIEGGILDYYLPERMTNYEKKRLVEPSKASIVFGHTVKKKHHMLEPVRGRHNINKMPPSRGSVKA